MDFSAYGLERDMIVPVDIVLDIDAVNSATFISLPISRKKHATFTASMRSTEKPNVEQVKMNIHHVYQYKKVIGLEVTPRLVPKIRISKNHRES